jgi:hypothetical protein
MHLCPKSTRSQNINGQPPTMQSMPCVVHARTASVETLPLPKDRWNQTRRTPWSRRHGEIS